MAAPVTQQVPVRPVLADPSPFDSASAEVATTEQAQNTQISDIVDRPQRRDTRAQTSIAELNCRVRMFPLNSCRSFGSRPSPGGWSFDSETHRLTVSLRSPVADKFAAVDVPSP